MEYTENDKRYLDKLRTNYPNRDIPTDDVDDLCIRTWEGIIEMELI